MTLIKAGLPAATVISLVSVKGCFIYRILGITAGADAMILYTVCIACLFCISMFVSGTHKAMIPIIGVLYGEKDFVEIRTLMKNILSLTLYIVGTCVLLMCVFPENVLSLFNIPEEITVQGVTAVRIFSLSLIGVACTFLMNYYYTTVQQFTAANILALTEGFFAVVPTAWILSEVIGIIRSNWYNQK